MTDERPTGEDTMDDESPDLSDDDLGPEEAGIGWGFDAEGNPVRPSWLPPDRALMTLDEGWRNGPPASPLPVVDDGFGPDADAPVWVCLRCGLIHADDGTPCPACGLERLPKTGGGA